MKSFTAGINENEMRLSRFVESVTNNMPASVMYKSFRNKRIKINGKKAEPDYRLKQGDLIELYINDEFFEVKEQPKPREIKCVKFDVVYEDENIAILYKPVHVLCHSDKTNDPNLAESFVQYLIKKGEYDENAENSFTPALCNRLDRGTEGLVLAGKNYAAVRDLNDIIKRNLIIKTYLCIGVGGIKKHRYKAYLKHYERDNKSDIKPYELDDYKEIITDVTPIKSKGPYTMYSIGLITGRTHQIRAHLSFLGAPLLGDIKYGNKKMNERACVRTQALCAAKLKFKIIPSDNTLHYLSTKEFEVSTASIEKIYDAL